ncbi:Translin-associated protein X [Mycena venus]|uniref:Translin-associated protein X n=1 Tax=Mycena venus TaxID=2733690 RepID=A0A8H7CLQ0_9AGAR|nr:Translin-associated protein X [Mycena venus]
MLNSVLNVFEQFREDLDEGNDRRERLIKASRDVTNISKKAIFLLHRIVLEDATDDRALVLRAAVSGREKLSEANAIFATMRPELVGDRFWRYQRQVSPGLQEYIEALSFAHYVEHDTLISYQQVQDALSDSDGPFFPLTVSDYLLGLSDLTGGCKSDFERFTPHVRDLSKKQSVTANSLEKIEAAAYAVAVRGSEYDLPQEMLDDLVAQATARFSITDRHEREGGYIESHV